MEAGLSMANVRHGLLGEVGVILEMRGKPGLCKAEASDLPLSAGRRFGPEE